MPQFLAFQAAIVVDDTELPEYTTEVSEENSEISCYIPSQIGKNFTVRWREFNTQRKTVGHVVMDGVYVGGRIMKDGIFNASVSDYRISREIVRPFCFAHLSLTDDESCATSAEKDMGVIRLELYPFISCDSAPCPPTWRPQSMPGAAKMHEHSKKVMTHCVGYGEDTKSVQERVASNLVMGKKLATFVFRYRPLDMLQAQGIAPRPQPAPPALSDKDSKKCKKEDITEVMDDGEADEARLKMLKAEIGKIESRLQKRQRTIIKSEDKDPALRGENGSRLQKRQKTVVKSEDKAFVAREVIELD